MGAGTGAGKTRSKRLKLPFQPFRILFVRKFLQNVNLFQPGFTFTDFIVSEKSGRRRKGEKEKERLFRGIFRERDLGEVPGKPIPGSGEKSAGKGEKPPIFERNPRG